MDPVIRRIEELRQYALLGNVSLAGIEAGPDPVAWILAAADRLGLDPAVCAAVDVPFSVAVGI